MGRSIPQPAPSVRGAGIIPLLSRPLSFFIFVPCPHNSKTPIWVYPDIGQGISGHRPECIQTQTWVKPDTMHNPAYDLGQAGHRSGYNRTRPWVYPDIGLGQTGTYTWFWV